MLSIKYITIDGPHMTNNIHEVYAWLKTKPRIGYIEIMEDGYCIGVYCWTTGLRFTDEFERFKIDMEKYLEGGGNGDCTVS